MSKKMRKVAEREHELSRHVTRLAESAPVRALTPLAQATDEPPLLVLGLSTLAVGAVLRQPVVVRSGARMVASHLVATGLKTLVKAGVDRRRPNAAQKTGPSLTKGSGTDDKSQNAFPSGHAAGAVAVAQAVAHEAPALGGPARWVAGAAGALQVPRGAHYASDVLAGAAIGWLSERIAGWAIARFDDAVAKRPVARLSAEAEAEAHPS